MGINHIRLSSDLIAALYPESLVAGKDFAPAEENVVSANPKAGKKYAPSKENVPASNLIADKTPDYPFMGENKRSICILANDPERDFLPTEQLEFLKKMLAACKLSLNDIALLNIAHVSFDLAELRLQLHPQILFLWGIPPASVGLKSDLPDFTVTMIDGISVIPVLEPDSMSENRPEGTEFKQRLWTCLKKLFTL
jgi:hypothetical protein